jgi:hypothetical protein
MTSIEQRRVRIIAGAAVIAAVAIAATIVFLTGGVGHL